MDLVFLKNIISSIQVCVFVMAIISLYFNSSVPQDVKPILLFSLVVVFAIIYILLEINTIKQQMATMKKRK